MWWKIVDHSYDQRLKHHGLDGCQADASRGCWWICDGLGRLSLGRLGKSGGQRWRSSDPQLLAMEWSTTMGQRGMHLAETRGSFQHMSRQAFKVWQDSLRSVRSCLPCSFLPKRVYLCGVLTPSKLLHVWAAWFCFPGLPSSGRCFGRMTLHLSPRIPRIDWQVDRYRQADRQTDI